MNIQGTLRSILGVPYFETSPCAELLQGMQGQTSPFLGMDPLGDLKAKRFQAVKVSPKTFLWFQSLKSLQYLYLQKIYRKSMNTCLFGYKLEVWHGILHAKLEVQRSGFSMRTGVARTLGIPWRG